MVGGPAIEQPADVRMLEPGERLALATEAARMNSVSMPGRTSLIATFALILLVIALREIDGAHAAAAKLSHQPIWTDARRRAGRVLV